MAIYSLAQRTTNLTITQASEELIVASPRVKVMEQCYTSQTATAQSLGIGRPAAQGVTPVNVVFQAEDPAEAASATNSSLSWATSPTAPAQFLRRWSLAATVGTGFAVVYPKGLVVGGAGILKSLVLWNITTALAGDLWQVIDE